MPHTAAHAPKWRYFERDGVKYRSCRLCPSYVEKKVNGRWVTRERQAAVVASIVEPLQAAGITLLPARSYFRRDQLGEYSARKTVEGAGVAVVIAASDAEKLRKALGLDD